MAVFVFHPTHVRVIEFNIPKTVGVLGYAPSRRRIHLGPGATQYLEQLCYDHECIRKAAGCPAAPLLLALAVADTPRHADEADAQDCQGRRLRGVTRIRHRALRIDHWAIWPNADLLPLDFELLQLFERAISDRSQRDRLDPLPID